MIDAQVDSAIKIAGLTLGAVVAAPVTVAAFKAIYFFGSLQKGLESSIARTGEKIDTFIERVDKMLEIHDSDIKDLVERTTTIEAERRTETRLGRRSTDPLTIDQPESRA